MFLFIPVENMASNNRLLVSAGEEVDIETLKAEAIAAGRPSSSTYNTRAEYRSRSASVAHYVLTRAKGICEACFQPAPFNRPDRTPYLEVHHTQRLADEGPDDIMHVTGICPNCHREAHFGPDTDAFRKRLEKFIAEKEGALDQETRADDHPAS
ncbi:MAG: HNH endonuclease [Planctomycetota bacterium]|nr:MAG: HNH endonuclease [Planctomycetota bacterium]